MGELETAALRRIADMTWRDFYQVTVLYFGWTERQARELWDYARRPR